MYRTVEVGRMASQDADERAVQRHQVKTELGQIDAQVASLPAERAGAKQERFQHENAAGQAVAQAQAQRGAAQMEIARLEGQLNQQLASLSAQEAQFAAQRDMARAELERPPEQRSRPAEALQPEIGQFEAQIAMLAPQRAQIQAQHQMQAQEPQNRLRQADLDEQAANAQKAQGEALEQQRLAQIDGREAQLVSRKQILEQELRELNAAEEEETAAAQQRLEDREERIRSLEAELQRLSRAVDGTRKEAASTAASDLSEFYASEAGRHASLWKRWLIGLATMVVAAGCAGSGLIVAIHPSDSASNAKIVTAVAIELLVVGLLLYCVRVVARQFNAHRNLEAIANSKAAALRTFRLMVESGSSPDARTELALILAQVVFHVEDAGFVDASSDGVTLPERIGELLVRRQSG